MCARVSQSKTVFASWLATRCEQTIFPIKTNTQGHLEQIIGNDKISENENEDTSLST